VCNGTNKCAGCDGIPNSKSEVDQCGVCGGDSLTCIGCDGVPNSGLKYDSCGECNGTDECKNSTKIVPDAPPILSPLGVGLVIGASVLAVVIGISVFAGYLIFQNVAYGALWYLPADFASKMSKVTNNPIYLDKQTKNVNPLAGKREDRKKEETEDE